jgi:hypothetical protein
MMEEVFRFIDFFAKEDVVEKYPLEKYDWESLTDRAFNDIAEGKTKNIPMLFRIGGQSGSGKSTQLLPAIKALFEKWNINPIHMAVRNFVDYCPHRDEIERDFGKENLRENTNAFALRLLFLVLKKTIEEKYPIIFEVTLLDNTFEGFLFNLLRSNSYRVEYHLMAVPKEISDTFIEKRKKGSGFEGNRVVSAVSKDYFFDRLPKAMEFVGRMGDKNPCFLWTVYDKFPVCELPMGDGETLKILERQQGIIKKLAFDEEFLRKSKIEWFLGRCGCD